MNMDEHLEETYKEMNKVDSRLLNLTNEFLEKFFQMAYVIEGNSEDVPRKKQDDSFVFHFTLADALLQSNHYVNDKHHNDSYGAYLCMSALSTNLAQGEMEYRTRGFFKKILTIIDNPEKCISDQSYMKIVSDKLEEKLFSECDFEDNKFKGFKDVKREYRVVKLNIWNSGNSMNLILDVIFTPKKYDEIETIIDEIHVYNPKTLILSKNYRKTEIKDITAIRDINGLFSAVNTIMFSIEYPEDM